MGVGRTLEYFTRVYIDGYDLSGYLRKLGDLKMEFAAQPDAAFSDAVKNIAAVGPVTLGIGELNGFFDNTANSGLHAIASGAGVKRTVLIAKGIRAAPAQGDPCYLGEFEQLDYKAQNENGNLVASIPFGDADAVAAHLAYSKPWGVLLHAKNAETSANSAVGVDDAGAQTTAGGYLCYQLLGSNGTVTLKIQDASNNSDGSFSDLSGATSGSIDASSAPKYGIVALATTATVKRYLRWQLAFGTASNATFVLAFVRG